jgi:plasmid stabilization system protein ParE
VSRQLRNVRAAREELATAVRWFEEQRSGLGAEFYGEVVATTDRLRAFPEGGTPISPDQLTRRVIVSRFPYQVVYRLTPTEIVVLAVAHLKRRPNYWKDRE